MTYDLPYAAGLSCGYFYDKINYNYALTEGTSMATLKISTENGTWTLHLSGSIDSGNAAAVEGMILAAGAKDPFVLDLEELEYLSSAGLRVILRLRRVHPGMKIIGAQPEIYNILDMTGFTALMPVGKAYRRLSRNGCEVIGSGANGDILRLDADTVVKIYKDKDSLDAILHEREMAKKAFIAGIPTAISYDVVIVDGDYASMFEMIDAQSLSQLLAAHPEDTDAYAAQYAELMKLVHETPAPADLPSMKERIAGWARTVAESGVLDKAAARKLTALIDAVPEERHVLHGDFHAKNIMLQKGEMILIDMDTLAAGHPIFELGTMYFSYNASSEQDHDSFRRFFGFPRETGQRLWKRILSEYFGTNDEAVLKDREEAAAVIGRTRFLHHVIRYSDGSEKSRREIAEGAAKLTALTTARESLV